MVILSNDIYAYSIHIISADKPQIFHNETIPSLAKGSNVP